MNADAFAPFTLPLRREGDAAIVDKNGKTVLVIDPDRDLEDDDATRIADHVFACISAAQPVAEEALPVAWVIRTKDGHIRMWTMSEARARTAAEAWGMEAKQEGLSPITHPAPDALREDPQAWGMLADLVSWFTKPVQGQNGMVWVIPAGDQGADDAVNTALAALQQEAK